MEGHRLCIAALLTTFAINFELMTLEEVFTCGTGILS